MKTKQKILEISKDLIQEQGANAFSYQDIADKLKIKKASIHYYFPHKNDLIQELVEFYSAQLECFLEKINCQCRSSSSRLKAYLSIYIDISQGGRKLCLCGILAGEIMTMPPKLKKAINRFFDIQEDWLTQLFMLDGLKNQCARQKAKNLFASLQGAMLLARSRGDIGYLKALDWNALTASTKPR
ncbi:MAG: hypothetical protein RLZZ361_648 [Cyanobacteriota bacterium]|jgi:TetR/AcrR family transcriptional repressor of nem operon